MENHNQSMALWWIYGSCRLIYGIPKLSMMAITSILQSMFVSTSYSQLVKDANWGEPDDTSDTNQNLLTRQDF